MSMHLTDDTPLPLEMHWRKWLPVVNSDLCTGCGDCIEACGPKSLELANHVASLVRPGTCGSEEHCIDPCKAGAITMAWVAYSGANSRGRWCA